MSLGTDLIRIELKNGLYQWHGRYPTRLEGVSVFDLLTEDLPEFEGTIITQPDEIYIWATSRSKGELWRRWSYVVGVNDQETGIRLIADPKNMMRYNVNKQGRTLSKFPGEATYRHSDKMTRGYVYIGEIGDVVNQFLSNGFVLKEK